MIDFYSDDWKMIAKIHNAYLLYFYLFKTNYFLDEKYYNFITRMLAFECEHEISFACIPERYKKMPIEDLKEFIGDKLFIQFQNLK